MGKKITLFYNYYNQENMLIKQVNLWKSYPNEILNQINILIVDDGSNFSAKNILNNIDTAELPLSLYRINEDKYCNIGGTRNLACKVCETEWIVIIDMDIIITLETLSKMFLLPLNSENIYKFNRIRPNKTFKIHPAVCLISKNTYWHIGGCDEDFVGNYGQTDVHFFHRAMDKNVKVYIVEDIFLIEDDDGSTVEINRSKEKLLPNIKLLENKKLNNNWSEDFIRFTWEKVELNN